MWLSAFRKRKSRFGTIVKADFEGSPQTWCFYTMMTMTNEWRKEIWYLDRMLFPMWFTNPILEESYFEHLEFVQIKERAYFCSKWKFCLNNGFDSIYLRRSLNTFGEVIINENIGQIHSLHVIKFAEMNMSCRNVHWFLAKWQ